MHFANQPQAVDADERRLIRVLGMLRFFGSFGFGALVAVRVLHFEAIGVSAAQIGLLMAGYSILGGIIEVPSGAVADVWGRRRAKIAANALSIVAYVVLAVALDVTTVAIGLAILAPARALASGSEQSWFVDEVGDAQSPAVLRGLSVAESAHNVGVALGAAVGGLLPWLLPDTSGSPFAAVFAIAATALLVEAAITLVGMVETTPRAQGDRSGVWPTTIDGGRSVVASPSARWVVVSMVGIGALTACVELLAPLGLSSRLTADRAAIVFGVLVAVAWIGSAAMAVVAPRLDQRAGSTVRAASIGTVVVALLSVPAAMELWLLPAAAYLVFNVVSAPLMPLYGAIVHREVSSAHRSTSISMLKLAGLAGATGGSAAVSVLSTLAFIPAAAVMLLAGLGLFRAGATADAPASRH